MKIAKHRFSASVETDHPAKPGHFPLNPIVPGVLLLENILNCFNLFSSNDSSIINVDSVKFHKPLMFGVVFEIEFQQKNNANTAFVCETGGELIAKGTLSVRDQNIVS